MSKKVINIDTGEIYVNIPALSIICNISKWWLYKMINQERPNRTPYVFYEDYIDKGHMWAFENSNIKKQKVILSNWEKIIDTKTGIIYDNKKDAAKAYGISTTELLRQLRGYYFSRGKKYIKQNNTTLEYYGKSL